MDLSYQLLNARYDLFMCLMLHLLLHKYWNSCIHVIDKIGERLVIFVSVNVYDHFICCISLYTDTHSIAYYKLNLIVL